MIVNMLDDRKKKILQAVIDEYIQSAEPVSSGAIAGKYSLNYSSATIRNEMADLEKEGYLDKPHTSSGRVPSAMGYRLYVDELLKEDNISLEEIKYIKSKLETRVNEIEELTKIAEVRPRTSHDMFGYNLDDESDTYIKRTFKLTVNGDDSQVCLDSKKLDKTVEEIHAQYLRPVSTSIGIFYECNAIMLDRIGNINQIGRGYMSEERIKEHGYQHYTDVLNLYPSLWTYYTSTELKDEIRENAEKIYERPTEFEVIDREDELDAARMTIRNTIDYCLDVAPSVVEARRAFKDMVDDLDEETLTALAIGNYQDATAAVTKQFEEKENPLFDPKEFKDGLDRRFSMLRTKDYDPYYDE